jgi:hypothetical protein
MQMISVHVLGAYICTYYIFLMITVVLEQFWHKLNHFLFCQISEILFIICAKILIKLKVQLSSLNHRSSSIESLRLKQSRHIKLFPSLCQSSMFSLQWAILIAMGPIHKQKNLILFILSTTQTFNTYMIMCQSFPLAQVYTIQKQTFEQRIWDKLCCYYHVCMLPNPFAWVKFSFLTFIHHYFWHRFSQELG